MFKSDWSFFNEAHDFLYAGRIYCVIILFTNAKEIMTAARSGLSDFLRLILETNFGSQLPVYQSKCSKQLLSILAEHSIRILSGVHVHLTQRTVFLRSDAAASIHFITRFTAATIRGRRLIEGSVY